MFWGRRDQFITKRDQFITKDHYGIDNVIKLINMTPRSLLTLFKLSSINIWHLFKSKTVCSFKMYKCSLCSYQSSKEFNVQRHINMCHNPDRVKYVCDHCGKELLTSRGFQKHMLKYHGCAKDDQIIAPEDHKKDQNISFEDHKMSTADEEESIVHTNGYKCDKCCKVFSFPTNLYRHVRHYCKGANPLQCATCGETFENAIQKHRHKQNCTGGATASTTSQQIAETINNTNTTNNVTNNNTNITNNVTNNNTVVMVYNQDYNQYDDGHITRKELKQLARVLNDNASKQHVRFLINYLQELLKNPVNDCVRKKHITNGYVQVHAGNGKWVTKTDKSVIPQITRDVAISANDKLYEHRDICSEDVRTHITNIASDDEVPERQLIGEIRAFLVDHTKECQT